MSQHMERRWVNQWGWTNNTRVVHCFVGDVVYCGPHHTGARDSSHYEWSHVITTINVLCKGETVSSRKMLSMLLSSTQPPSISQESKCRVD